MLKEISSLISFNPGRRVGFKTGKANIDLNYATVINSGCFH